MTEQTERTDIPKKETISKKSNLYSWLILILSGYILIGYILYPSWWYDFFVLGGIFSLRFWIGGIRAILEYLMYNPVLIIAIIAGLILAFRNKDKIKLPKINLFQGNKVIIPIILPIFIVLIIWSYNRSHFIHDDVITSEQYEKIIAEQNKKEEAEAIIKLPVDFYYLNQSRIKNLYSQIKPDLVLKEKQLEFQNQKERGIKGGNDLLNAENKEGVTKKETNSYKREEAPLPKQTTQLLNHFHQKQLIKVYENLELASEDVKKLEDFKSTAKQFGINFNTSEFNSVYSRIYSEKLIEENKKLKSLTGQVLVKGEYSIKSNESNISLEHYYIKINGNQGIKFTITPISPNDKNLLSTTFKDRNLNGKNLNLNVFGKVVRFEEQPNITEIYIEPYAVW